MSDPITLDDIARLRAVVANRVDPTTHYDGCHVGHPWCAVARILPLAELALSGEREEEWQVSYEYKSPRRGWIPTSVRLHSGLVSANHAALMDRVGRTDGLAARNVRVWRRTVTTITGPWERVEETPNG